MGEHINRFFQTVNQSQDAFLDMLRSNNERAYRFSKIVIEEAARTQQEQTDLAKQWMEAPLDPIGFTKSTLETWTRRQRRRFELTRTFFDEMTQVRDETRHTVERVAEAGREAIGVGSEAGRAAASRAAEAGRTAAARVSAEVAERAEGVSEAAAAASARNSRNRSNN